MRTRRSPIVAFLVVALVAVTLGACKTGGPDPIAMTADYRQRCASGAATPEQCKRWSAFFERFRSVYLATHERFKATAGKADSEDAIATARILRDLGAELAIYAIDTRRR